MAFQNRKSQEKDDVEELLTREEKEALLDQKIMRMKIKNAERMKKFQEIQEDKMWAEREGRAVSLKNPDLSDNEDDSWPKRADRFESVDEGHHQQPDLRKALQQKRGEIKADVQPNVGGRQNTSKYKSIVADGPPPDPAYNYLADRDRDSYGNEKREDGKSRRGFPRRGRGDQRQNDQRSNQHGPDRFQQRQMESRNDETRANYDHWRKERDNIDRERIERQKTREGWKREWDWDKNENNQPQKNSPRLLENAGPHCDSDATQKMFVPSEGSQSRGTSYRGGRGRGRARADAKSGSTPDREVGTNYQRPPRFRNSPDTQRPGNAIKQPIEPNSANLTSYSVRSEVHAVNHNLQGDLMQSSRHEQKDSSRNTVIPLADVIVNPTIRNYNSRGSIVITVDNQGHNEKSEPVIRSILKQEPCGPEISPDAKLKSEFLTPARFPKSPKKGIGSGRIAPPPKGRSSMRGKDVSRRAAPSKGRRFGNHSSTSETESEEVTIGIAVITTPGEKDESAGDIVDITEVVEEVNCDSVPVKKTLESSNRGTVDIGLLEDEIDEGDDDDDEWEDVDDGSAELDDDLKQELNKSNESIHRFIEENTLHPDGTNWNIDVDGDNIPWSEQVDAESQERHRLENDWPKLRQSDSFVDTSFQSSCSIVESPFEQSEVLSSLLAAACDSSHDGSVIEPGNSSYVDESEPENKHRLSEEFVPQDATATVHESVDKTDGGSLSFETSEMIERTGPDVQDTESLETNKLTDIGSVNSETPVVNGVKEDVKILDVELVTPDIDSLTTGSVVSQPEFNSNSEEDKPTEDQLEVKSLESSSV